MCCVPSAFTQQFPLNEEEEDREKREEKERKRKRKVDWIE
jgi:hypothetical protein